MIRKPLAFLAASLLASCTSGSDDNSEMITSSDGQSFLVEHTEWPAQRFPSNNDLKMVDGDLTRYGADLCGITSSYGEPPQRCDLFVQGDPSGTMIGYAALLQTSSGVFLKTQVDTNKDAADAEAGCGIDAFIFKSGAAYEETVTNSAKPFTGQVMYSAAKNYGDDFMVSFSGLPDNEPSGPESPDAARGVWYIERTNDKLRIEQERWSYCYRDTRVDDVFFQAISFVPAHAVPTT